LPLRTVSLLAYLFFIAIFATAMWLGQHFGLSQIRDIQERAQKATARSISEQLNQLVRTQTETLEGLIQDPALHRLLRTGDQTAINARARELKSIFKGALALRIFPAGTGRIDKQDNPPITYACMDLLQLAKQGKARPPVEVHGPGTPQAHIGIVRPITDGNQVLGQVQLVLDTSLLDRWLSRLGDDTLVHLTQHVGDQGSVLLGKHGDLGFKAGDEESVPVEGTSWTLTVWVGRTVAPLAFGIQVLVVFFLAVILFGVVLWFLKRSMSRAMRSDLNNILSLTVEVFRGTKQHDYALVMPEFREAARRIHDLRNDERTMERERDDDPNAVSVGSGDFSTTDPLFMSGESISVEELDEGTMSTASMAQPETPESAAAGADQAAASKPNPFLAQQSPAGAATSSVADAAGAPATPPPEIFKAYDIRGIVGQTLTLQHATLIGRALGSEAIERGLDKIAFARDGRLSGPELGAALVQGLREAGIDVVDIGMVPTPVLYFAATKLTGGTGVMLTGSHNPPNYNGFKMMLGGVTLSGDDIQQLRQRIEQQNFKQGSGGLSNQPVAKEYVQRIVGDVKLQRPLRIAIDCGNGVAGAIAPALFKALGCQVVPLYCEVDGTFPNHHPDPSKPENMKELINTVVNQRLDVGLAFDGDGDRLGVISSDGKNIYADRLLMLFAADVLSRNHGAQIIYDIKCSNNLTKVIWEKGGEPVMWKTGHSLIKAKMKQSGALLAGEMSGHIFFQERWYGFDDGLYAAARLLELLSKDRRPAAEIFNELPDAVSTPELNVQMREGEQHRFIEELMSKADFGEASVTMIDGIRADYADGWGLVRASNTTPVLVLRFEGTDEAAMKRIQEIFRKQMLAVKQDLKLPF
jgi:phosphomannomutase/phosphoglucomutase